MQGIEKVCLKNHIFKYIYESLLWVCSHYLDLLLDLDDDEPLREPFMGAGTGGPTPATSFLRTASHTKAPSGGRQALFVSEAEAGQLAMALRRAAELTEDAALPCIFRLLANELLVHDVDGSTNRNLGLPHGGSQGPGSLESVGSSGGSLEGDGNQPGVFYYESMITGSDSASASAVSDAVPGTRWNGGGGGGGMCVWCHQRSSG